MIGETLLILLYLGVAIFLVWLVIGDHDNNVTP